MKLTPLQTARLASVTEAARAYRYAKMNLEAELRARLRAEMDAELSGLKSRQDQAAFRAHQVGVPKSRIGVDGLLTKNPQAATDAINAGKLSLEGTLEDEAARDSLLTAAQPEPDPYIHPQRGYVLANPQPFGISDDPEYPFTISTPAGQVIPFRVVTNDSGYTRFDYPPAVDADLPELGYFLNAGAPEALRLREAAHAYIAAVSARENS